MSARTYTIGLPVTVTIHDDGRVEYEIDTAETGVAMWEDEEASESYDEATVEADAARADADHEHRRNAR